MKSKLKFVTVPALIILALLTLRSQSEAQTKTRDVMRAKLRHSQSVLEGIATENFPLIATNAANLKQLSQSAGWEFRKTEEYQRLSSDFVRQVEAMAKAAQNENVHAATIAYFQMTVSCVNCHRYLRGASVAQVETPISLRTASAHRD